MTDLGSRQTRRRCPTTDWRILASGFGHFTAIGHLSTSSRDRAAVQSLVCAFRSTQCLPRQTAMPASWRVVVADDEPAARRGVRQLLSRFSEFTIVGECRDGREVLDALDALEPD